ncbi:hypothetical protein RISK_000059 [Rhodopirellula islandica]|uniref:Uncharacterized protein n=1 Tax=Rhodopirellula islandica TaxID=595434 RepID=A0A0J1BN39_RHOIS|nr:hypothetical protein RISK_000059 [Rhodopirellula islandica]
MLNVKANNIQWSKASHFVRFKAASAAISRGITAFGTIRWSAIRIL